jgi:lysophospholipase L1-like esterase
MKIDNSRINAMHRLCVCAAFALLAFGSAKAIVADRIMPVGNSITWGKVNNAPPPAGEEGYRKYLNDLLAADATNFPGGVEFVGSEGVYKGYFFDNARIGWFIHADSTKGDIANVIDTYQPDIVILEIGTNNVGVGMQLGNSGTEGSVMWQLNILIRKFIQNANVDHLLLCKIIPKLNTPGAAAETINFNNAVEILVQEINSPKIALVDLWTPFYAKQTEYYNLDVDRVHPNTLGYKEMANIFYQHLKKIKVPSFTDEFNRAAIGTDWVYTTGMTLLDKGESGGGALMFNVIDNLTWDNLAIWKKSENLTTVSMKIHSTADVGALSSVGLAVGLNKADVADADGYLVWVYNNKVNVKTIVNGVADVGTDVPTPSGTMAALQPGDILKVTYRRGETENALSVSVPNRSETIVNISDPNKLAGNSDLLYSGIMFRGNTVTVKNYPIDNFVIESQLPDVVAPAPPIDFAYFSPSKTSVLLSWKAPGNDGYSGTAASYDMRYSTSSISDPKTDPSTWNNATLVTGLPAPKAAGTFQDFTVTGLLPGTRYYFRMRAVDAWGNQGDLSTEITFRTKDAGFITDLFARQAEADGSIGDDWVIDPNEYTIQYNSALPEESELVNYQTDLDWGRVAVYTAVSNPTIAKLVWGRNSTPAGIYKAGLALMLDSPSLSANGYLLWIRHTSYLDKIFLYNIVNGDVVQDATGKIDEVAYTLKDNTGNLRLPQKGDTMTVVMDWYNPSGIKFDVLLNGKPASDQPLFDPDKRHNSATKYAGVMLSRMNKTNGVTAFSVSAERTGVGGLEAVSGDGASAVAGTALADSLRLIVRDTNRSPLDNIPVWFWVTEPADATVSSPALMIDPLHIEAEWDLDPDGTYMTYDDPLASGTKYMNAATGGAGAGQLSYTFYVEKDTTYYFWGRVIASKISNMAVGFQVDNTQWVWNCNYINSTSNSFSTSWRWDRVRHNSKPDTPVSMRLTKGEHTLLINKLHDNVKLDKFLITSSSTLVPTLTMPIDILKTNAQGKAAAKLVLGKKAGMNVVRARAFGSGTTIEFQVSGRPDAPVKVVASNQNQNGTARKPLTNPFVVTLYDQYNNITPNITVQFTQIQGDGSINPASTVTDATGRASTLLTLGYEARPHIVQASFPGTTLNTVNFTGTPVAGLASQVLSLVVKGTARHYISQVFPNFLQVKVLDDAGKPMNDVPVTFQASGIPATFGVKAKKTNASGIATDTLKLGAQTGVLNVSATAAGITNVILVDSVYNRGTKIIHAGGNNRQVGVNDTTLLPLKVKVFNGYEAGVNHPVTFVAKGYGFRFVGQADSVTVRTDINGYAQTYVIAGPIHGQYAGIIEARANNGFDPLDGSPFKFTLTAVSDASRLVYVQGDNQEGVVLEELPLPLQVRMVRVNGAPVEQQPVLFSIKSGRGKFIETKDQQYQDLTDGEGIAEVFFQLGDKAGVDHVNVVEATATNGDPTVPLGGTPVQFELMPKSSSADSLKAVSSLHLSGTVGKPLAQPVKVMVIDEFGNPVAGETVRFSIIGSGGSLAGTADTTRDVVIPKADGIAQIIWTLNTHMGTDNNELRVTAGNGLRFLDGSPVTFYASSSPDTVNAYTSLIQAAGPKQATGADSSKITVTLKDKYGNPVSGKMVKLSVDPLLESYFNSSIGPTDAEGEAFGYLLSTKAGEKKVSGLVVGDNITISDPAEVLFLANDATRLEKITTGSLKGNVGTVFRDSLVVRVTDDKGNPVAFGPVTFKASGGGSIVGNPVKVSNVAGLAWAYVILGPEPGENVYEISAKTPQGVPLTGSPVTFRITGEQSKAISMFRASEAMQVGSAGSPLPRPFITGVIDDDGDPVAGVEIVYTVVQGGGSMITPNPVKTNAWGQAEAYFRADTQVDMENLILATANLANSPILFTCPTVAGAAYELKYESGNNQSGLVGRPIASPMRVKTTDRYGNPVSGIQVKYEVVEGDAAFGVSSSASDTSNAGGIVSMGITLGNSTGLVRVRTSSRFLMGSPVIFNLYCNTSNPVNILRYPDTGGVILGTVNKPLPDPLRVMVVDANGNPVRNTSVVFGLSSGSGAIQELDPVISDEHGIAEAHFVCGPTPGISQVKAVWLTKDVYFAVQAVSNPNSPALDKDVTGPVFDVFEGDLLTIPIRAFPDGDGDVLTFEIEDLFPPMGLRIEKQSPITAVMQWTPTHNQQGSYTVHFRVVDGRGGFDADSVLINVLKTNRPPVLLSTYPTFPDTILSSGQVLPFWVEAEDPDGDELHYSWRVDGIRQGEDSPLLEWDIDKYFSGSQTVDVKISDGMQETSFRWTLDVVVSVTMTEMTAVFQPWLNLVNVQWKTGREVDNAGFHVYRSLKADGEYQKITSEIIPSRQDNTYSATDNDVQVGAVYYYKIVAQDVRGNRSEQDPIMIRIPVPDQFGLAQNYPNPFNPSTTIRYFVPYRARLTLRIFNMMGQMVRTSVDEEKDAGYFTLEWDGKDSKGRQAATGVYIYQLITPKEKFSKRMLKLQ